MGSGTLNCSNLAEKSGFASSSDCLKLNLPEFRPSFRDWTEISAATDSLSTGLGWIWYRSRYAFDHCYRKDEWQVNLCPSLFKWISGAESKNSNWALTATYCLIIWFVIDRSISNLNSNGISQGRLTIYAHCCNWFWNWSIRVSHFAALVSHYLNHKLSQQPNLTYSLFSYGIAPRLLEPGAKPRIEVFNPCDESDDQKTSTAILFSDSGDFLAFGTNALQRYAEMLDDEETGMLF